MKTTYIATRKHRGEEYKFFLHTPETEGEKGICGIEIEPYISVETPENGFSYPDTILMDHATGNAYTLYRHLAPSTLKAIQKQMKSFLGAYHAGTLKIPCKEINNMII